MESASIRSMSAAHHAQTKKAPNVVHQNVKIPTTFKLENFLSIPLEIKGKGLPVIREDGIIQDDLLEQLDQLVRQVGSHECLDGHRYIFRILSL